MKARVISIGKIVEVKRVWGYLDHNYETEEGECFAGEELDFSGEPDYWTRLEHQYAGMAMQGLMSYVEQITPKEGRSFCDEIVGISVKVAHALVEKMKEERK